MKVLLFLLALLVIAVVCYGIYKVAHVAITKSRQRKMAMSAPHLLMLENNVDPKIAELLTEQHMALTTGTELVSSLLADPAVLVPSEYAEPLNKWLTDTKEIDR